MTVRLLTCRHFGGRVLQVEPVNEGSESRGPPDHILDLILGGFWVHAMIIDLQDSS